MKGAHVHKHYDTDASRPTLPWKYRRRIACLLGYREIASHHMFLAGYQCDDEIKWVKQDGQESHDIWLPDLFDVG